MTLDELLALAEKATPGPWIVDETQPDDVVIYTAEDKRWVVNVGNWSRQSAPDTHPDDSDYLRNAFEADSRDARYIAACSPEVVKALVAVAQAAEGLHARGTPARIRVLKDIEASLDALTAVLG